MSTFGKIGASTLVNHKKFARDYVQDGLVTLWDGIENVGWGSRNTSSTKWVDLCAPSKTGFSIISGKSSWGDASFNFNANYGERIGTYRFKDLLLASGGAGSLEICLQIDSVTNDAALIFGVAAQNSLRLGYDSPWSQHYNYYCAPMSNHPYKNESFVGSGIAMTFANATRSGDARMYVNGQLVKSSTNSLDYNGAYNCTLNAGYAGTLQGVTAKIYRISVYNRQLTAGEIAHNHNIDKIRFNLPS